MNRQETIRLLAMLQSNYPNAYKDFDSEMLNAAVQLWQQTFQDMDARLVFNVVSKILMTDTSDFPPKIGVIRQECVKALNPTAFISPEKAWEQVLEMVKKFGYYQKDQAFKHFSNPVKRAVNAIGWDNICKSENIGIERSNFYKMYNSLEQENKERIIMPKAMLDRLHELTSQTAIEQGRNNDMSKL